MVITGANAEPAFIRTSNRFPLNTPMSSGLTPLASQTAMAWSQWNTRYKAPGSQESISISFLYQCGTNCSTNFCHRHSKKLHNRTSNTVIFLLFNAMSPPGTRYSKGPSP
ncbi:hypothetical protein TNCV_2665471 [Trichonephila clavipes]|nr:hypothetical protein TNCV_2665471 [Trichonephila clavipes]